MLENNSFAKEAIYLVIFEKVVSGMYTLCNLFNSESQQCEILIQGVKASRSTGLLWSKLM